MPGPILDQNPAESSFCGSVLEDPENLNLWTTFLTEYANGAGESVPKRPPLPPDLQKRLDNVTVSREPWPFCDSPLYPSTTITVDIARIIRDYYCDHGYLPPPRAPLEAERNQCIQDYDLYSPTQLANIQSATDLIAAVFPDSLTTFSLFQDRVQTYFAFSGPEELIKQFQLTVGLRIPAEDSFCGHAILLDQKVFFVPDVQHDWRYLKNPYALAGWKSFVGSPVSLELDPRSRELLSPMPKASSAAGELTDPTPPTRVSIGTLNITFVKSPHRVLTKSEQVVIDSVTKMLETQLRGSWEGDQRRRDGRARLALSDFIEETLVENDGQQEASNTAADPMGDGRVTMRRLAQSAVDKIIEIIVEADSISVWDVRAFSRQSGPAQYVDFANYPLVPIAARSMSRPIPRSLPPSAVAKMLSATAHLFAADHPSGLESSLPPSTASHLALSFSDANEPVYMFLITTLNGQYHFPPSDINLIRNLGSVLLARSIQARFLKADSAKTSFLSAISHELRTPMHAVMQSHALMRQALDSQEYTDLSSLLSLSESSSRTLTNILNDVLDYGKAATGDYADDHQCLVSDLADMTVQIVKMTRIQYIDETVPVELFVEWEDRDWNVKIDEARFQRVLMNGLTNAMKFCRIGSITVRLTSQADNLVVQVIDTGIGFDESMMPQVLQAFTKLDKHSAGAGLGLHITKTMLDRAGGSLRLQSKVGAGTTFEAILPVSFIGSAAPNSSSHHICEKIATAFGLPPPPNGGAPSSVPSNTEGDTQSTTPPPPWENKSSITVASPSNKETTSNGVPLRILVVDDNSICRQLLAKTVRKGRSNVKVQVAEDGVQALKIFGEWSPNLVLTDVSMPNMGGIESAEKMRERENSDHANSPKSQIYAITALGKTDPRSISMGMNGHASLDGWLVKGQDLTKVVSSIVDDMTKLQVGEVEVVDSGQEALASIQL